MELGRRGRQSGKGAVTRRLEDRARGREAVDSDPGNRFNDIGSTTSFTHGSGHSSNLGNILRPNANLETHGTYCTHTPGLQVLQVQVLLQLGAQ